MGITKEEARERIYGDIEDWGELPNEDRFDPKDTSLEDVFFYDDGSFFGDYAVYIGVLDDRAVTPESLEIAQDELQYLADELSPSKFLSSAKQIILIAISEGVDQATREYIHEAPKMRGGDSHYIFVIDCPAKSIVYNEYTGWGYGKEREYQAEMADELYKPIQ